MSARPAAARFGIGISTAIAWIASARQGQVSAAKQGRPGGSRLDDHEAFIIGMIEASKDITLKEMVLRLEEDPIRLYRPQHPRRLAAQARLHIQKKTAHALEQERPDLLKRRRVWFDGQLDLDPEKLIFIDESVLQRHGRSST